MVPLDQYFSSSYKRKPFTKVRKKPVLDDYERIRDKLKKLRSKGKPIFSEGRPSVTGFRPPRKIWDDHPNPWHLNQD